MTEFYLSLNKDALKRTEKIAIDKAKENDPNDVNTLTYSDLRLDISEMYFDDEKERLVLNGNIYCGNEDLGYVSSYDLPMDLDLIIDLVQVYMKKLGKLKTVLEATK